jgi:hypothetical protein
LLDNLEEVARVDDQEEEEEESDRAPVSSVADHITQEE